MMHDKNATQYLRVNVHVPAEGSLGIGYTVLILLLTISTSCREVPVFLLQHGVGEEWVLLEVLKRHMSFAIGITKGARNNVRTPK